MSRYETDIDAYTGVTAASAMVGAAAVFAATSSSINRAIMIARTNAVRRLIADRIRRISRKPPAARARLGVRKVRCCPCSLALG